MVKKNNSVLYGSLAGLGIIGFYLTVISIFQSFEIALFSLRNLWYWIFPLAAGFGTQIGLYTSIRHTAALNAEVATTGTFSAGSMVACCSHYVLSLIPIAGATALGIFLLEYQEFLFGIGILANIFGIGIMLKHKKRLKGGKC